MRILVVEDEVAAARGLTNLIHEIVEDVEIACVTQSVTQTVDWLKSNTVDLAFFDIQLKDGLSFEIFEKIEVQFPVIFCTAFDQYAIDAFKVNSVDYLLKPIEKEALAKSITKFRNLKVAYGTIDVSFIEELKSKIQSKQYKQRFLVKAGKKLFHVNRADMAYVFTSDKIVYVISKKGQKFQLDYNLDQLESLLPDNEFFRINRQYIVNIDSITAVENDYGTYFVTLDPKTSDNVSVSRYRLNEFKSWMDDL